MGFFGLIDDFFIFLIVVALIGQASMSFLRRAWFKYYLFFNLNYLNYKKQYSRLKKYGEIIIPERRLKNTNNF